jgi:ABC-type transport system substrate-binding protein
LLTEAGFPVVKNGDEFECPTFPVDRLAINFNTNENNKSVAEFLQAQWKRNLGVTVPLKTMEFKTYLPFFKSLQYEGFAQFLWSGDYMDPYTFLSLQYGKDNEGAAGFYDPKYDKLLDDANVELDAQKRYELMARAEEYLMEQLPMIPLTVNATNWMKKPYVKGMYPNPGTLLPWKFVYIERDPAKWDKDVANIMNVPDAQVDQQLADLVSTQKAVQK